MAKWAARLTVVDPQGGAVAKASLGRGRWKKRKKNRARDSWLWPVEHVAREYMRAETVCWSEMGRLHRRSVRKRGDWFIVEDPTTNCLRVHEKAIKSFLRRI